MNSISNRFFGPRESSTIALALLFICLFIFFYGLGGVAFFEPTEGRNAIIAREILITHDWVTPHDNFIPVLDKPIRQNEVGDFVLFRFTCRANLKI